MRASYDAKNGVIVARCMECGIVKEEPCTPEQWKGLAEHKKGIGQTFPHLSLNDREIFISAICGDCYNRLFPEEEEEEE